MGCKCKISVEIYCNVSKMIQANSLLFNYQMKSPCYLITLSSESSDFLTFLKQNVILVPSAIYFFLSLIVISLGDSSIDRNTVLKTHLI